MTRNAFRIAGVQATIDMVCLFASDGVLDLHEYIISHEECALKCQILLLTTGAPLMYYFVSIAPVTPTP